MPLRRMWTPGHMWPPFRGRRRCYRESVLMKKSIHAPRRGRLGNRLWQYRKRMGFSQEQVATIVGHVSRDLISHYERGKRMPSLTTAMKLEIVYRVPISFLFP